MTLIFPVIPWPIIYWVKKDNNSHFHLNIRFLKIISWLLRNYSVTANWEKAWSQCFWVCGSAFGGWMHSLKLHKSMETLWKRENQEWRGGPPIEMGLPWTPTLAKVMRAFRYIISFSPVSEIIKDQKHEPQFKITCLVLGWVRTQHSWLPNLCFCNVPHFTDFGSWLGAAPECCSPVQPKTPEAVYSIGCGITTEY